MDRKKLIGTIIGVIMFGLLMAGATYAWLSFTANVINATYNAQTFNYWVDYTKGTDLTDLPIVSSTPTTGNTAHIVLKAQRPFGSIANNITIYLNTTSNNTLTTSTAIKYVICEGACTTTFTSSMIKSVSTGGSTTTPSQVSILTGTLEGTAYSTNNAEKTYNIYMWIDAATLTNAHLNQTYSGFISASSSQDTTTYG